MKELMLGMTIARASAVAEAWWEFVPEVPGIYAVLLDRGEDLLRRCGYPEVCDDPAPLIGDKLLANIGMTRRLNLRRRINHHLYGDSRVSSLRRSIAILFGPPQLVPVGKPGTNTYHFGSWEEWITEFLLDNASFAWRPSKTPAQEEFSLIRQFRPLLNIKGLEQGAFAQHLTGRRQEWADAT